MSFTGHASPLFELEEEASRLSIPSINEMEKTSLGGTLPFPLRDTPIDLLKPILRKVFPEDIIRLYMVGDKKLIYSLKVSVEEARQFTPFTIRSLKFFVNTFKQIRSLYLPHCNLTKLPKDMSLPQSLKILDLSENAFEDGKLPQGVLTLSYLEELNLMHCSLTELPEDMPSPQTLRILNLAQNKFEDRKFPQAILKLSRLEELNLADCYLSELPADMSSLSVLRILEISHNKFTDGKFAVFGLTCLEEVKASYSSLTELPADMSSLRSLKILRLAGNRFMDANYIEGLRLQYPSINIEF